MTSTMDSQHQSNGDVDDEMTDAIHTTTPLDSSSVNINNTLDSPAATKSDDGDVDDVVGNASPRIGSPAANTNESESNVSQEAGISNEKATDESPADIDENKSLFRLEFENEDVFDELATVISSRIREALASLNKTVAVSVDKVNNRISFSKTDDTDMFMIDTLPTDKVHKSEVPSYKSVTEALRRMNANRKDAANDANDKPKSGGCWNCGGDHNMRECKEPLNRENIARGRQSFQRTKTERYHLDADQKFAHFLPGTISESLREALGLRKRELPLYIYKMRLYGYPPGWLEEAKVTRSGLTLFNAENSSIPDPAVEEGEVDKVTFDSKQFISFPGFNAAVPDGFIDDSSYYRVPPMQYQHSREGLMQSLAGNLAKSYKRKKLKLSSDSPSTQPPTANDEDMEIESDSDSAGPVLFPLPRPSAGDSSNSADTSQQSAVGDTDSPSVVPENALDSSAAVDASIVTLTDLEKQKEELLQALANANENTNSNSNGSPVVTADANPVETNAVDEECALDVTATNETNEYSQVDSPSTPHVGRSREIVVGTPLLKTVSPFASLPSDDKWGAGVSGVIDFENLPDATGTYKRLRGLISTVRTVVKQINDQNDAEDDDDDL